MLRYPAEGEMPTKKTPRPLTALEIAQAAAEEQGPFANRDRAAEIALMDEFGLAEFTELTGVGVGDYGIYRVARTGISLRASESLADFMASQQNTILQAERTLTLGFPCPPAEFLAWYEATRGTEQIDEKGQCAPGISDFSLAEGFVGALKVGGGQAKAGHKHPEPTPRIIAAFRVMPDAAENVKWWDNRLRHADRYKLTAARASTGRGGTPSRWHPLQIAIWLIDKNHLSAEKVRQAVEEHFPKVDTSLLI